MALASFLSRPATHSTVDGFDDKLDDDEDIENSALPQDEWTVTQSFPGAINVTVPTRKGKERIIASEDSGLGEIGQQIEVLTWEEKEWIVYASSSSVVVLDSELSLYVTLPTKELFTTRDWWWRLRRRSADTEEIQNELSDPGPLRNDSLESQSDLGADSGFDFELDLGGICCDSARGFIYTWWHNELLCLQPTRVRRQLTWKLYGTLVLQSGAIHSVDIHDETLLIATDTSLELWDGDLSTPIPLWSRKWTRPHQHIERAILSTDQSYVAWYHQGGTEVYVQGLMRDLRLQGLSQSLKHSKKIRWLQWSAQNPDSLYVIGEDSVIRTYSPVLDDPTWFQLGFSFSIEEPEKLIRGPPRSGITRRPRPMVPFAIVLEPDAEEVQDHHRGSGDSESLSGGRARRRRDTSRSERLFWLGSGGEIKTITIEGLDRSPPELIGVKTPTICAKAPTRFPNPCKRIHILTNDKDDRHRALLISADALQPVPIDATLTKSKTSENSVCLGDHSRIQSLEYDGSHRTLLCGHGPGRLRSFQRGQKGHWSSGNSSKSTIPTHCESRVKTNTEKIACISTSSEKVTLVYLPSQMRISIALGFLADDETLCFLGEVVTASATRILLLGSKGHSRLYSMKKHTDKLEDFVDIGTDPEMSKILSKTGSTHTSLTSSLVAGSTLCTIVSDVEGITSLWTCSTDSTSPRWSHYMTIATYQKGVLDLKLFTDTKLALLTNTGVVSIWDVRQQEFCSAPQWILPEDAPRSRSISWTTVSHGDPALCIASDSKITVVSQTPSSLPKQPLWQVSATISAGKLSPHTISAVASCGDDTAALGAGNQLLVYRRCSQPSSTKNTKPEKRNTSLPEYHPLNLAMILMVDRPDLAHDIQARLQTSLKRKADELEDAHPKLHYEEFDAFQYLKEKPPQGVLHELNGVSTGFEVPLTAAACELSKGETRSLTSVFDLVSELLGPRLKPDLFGVRYLALLAIDGGSRQRASDPRGHLDLMSAGSKTVWAYYSESQNALVDQTLRSKVNGKLLLRDAASSGIFLWLHDKEQLRIQAEAIAANEYIANDRDPIACSLLYFALGKKSTVFSLWKQAHGHNEQGAMLKFLANDFDEQRWKTAAKKNAYALMSKQRFAYAAAFFVLAGSYKDAINVCVRQVPDLSLAIALARLLDAPGEDELLVFTVREHLLPISLEKSNRWLCHWGLMIIKDYRAAVEVILTPLDQFATKFGAKISHNQVIAAREPTLVLLLDLARQEYRMGQFYSDVVSTDKEYRFLLYAARNYWQMGCRPIALRLLAKWNFSRQKPRDVKDTPKVDSTPNATANGASTPIPQERSEHASLVSAGALKKDTQGAMEFDMGAFF